MVKQKHANLVVGIADVVLSRNDARDAMAALDAQLAAFKAEKTSVLEIRAHQRSLETVRARLLADAENFAELVSQATRAEMRELLLPWIIGGTIDQGRRTLTLELRVVPDVRTALQLEPSRCGRSSARRKHRNRAWWPARFALWASVSS